MTRQTHKYFWRSYVLPGTLDVSSVCQDTGQALAYIAAPEGAPVGITLAERTNHPESRQLDQGIGGIGG